MIRKTVKIALCTMAGALVMSSCTTNYKFVTHNGNSVITKMSVQIEPEKPSVFTHPSLQKFIKQNKGASVVVRDPNATSGGVSAAGKTNELCGVIERALMKKGYNPRDRRLFESVAEKMKDMDYVALGEKTKTDLVFEVTDFSQQEYVVRSYQEYKDWFWGMFLAPVWHARFSIPYLYLKKDAVKQKSLKEPRTFSGYSIEIKVILLQDNLIGGTYRYFWTPCSSPNCDFVNEKLIGNISRRAVQYPSDFVVYSAIYTQDLKKKIADKTLSDEERFDASEKLAKVKQMKKTQRKDFYIEELTKELEAQWQPINLNEFVSDVVIPSLFRDMGEEAAQKNSKTTKK
ncbi:MAG: hypothetical protein LBT94_07045 [Prevotellaceae bacterium]|jgi:hypothetical protein|nr:hypothetical protein [Prevotellaceae bacterium]